MRRPSGVVVAATGVAVLAAGVGCSSDSSRSDPAPASHGDLVVHTRSADAHGRTHLPAHRGEA